MRLLIPGALLTVGVLGACTPDGGNSIPDVVISHVDPGALSAAYVTDWSVFETAANNLRNSNPLYTIQKISGFFGGSVPDSYSLKHGRVEYAHAAGLTGAGQTIAIIDNGFLRTHQEFAGKSIDLTPGYAPSVSDHGTAVASVATGVSTGGNMIGVAPGASLALGDFDPTDSGYFNFASVTAATYRAASQGAIVQNNSWGFTDPGGIALDITASNFNSVFGNVSGDNYLTALKNFANNGVVVFALPNENPSPHAPRTHADLMGALPVMVPSLQDSWIAVVNAVPTFSGNNITSATMISPYCYEAAAWCLAADGTVYSAVSTGNSDYATWTGTSFAAPQVSGGIALLAEAFPTLSHTELRARLLASADNSFFAHDGYVEFASNVKHGFSTQLGHGFMNLQAALSPIGGSYLPRSNGQMQVVGQGVSATVASVGMAGNVMGRSLTPYDLATVDGLGAGFDVSASLLTAEVDHRYDPLGSIKNLISVDLDSSSFDPLTSETLFAAVETGQQVDFAMDGPSISLLLPTDEQSSYGLALSQMVDLGVGNLELGISAVQEIGGLAGIKPLLDGDDLGGVHGAVSMAYTLPVGREQSLQISGSVGGAVSQGHLTDMQLSDVGYNAFGLSYSAGDVLGSGDRFSIGLGLPNAIQSGHAQVTMPVSNGAGGVGFSTLDIPLSADARQLDISANYGFSVFDGADMVLSAVRRLNDGNIAGNDTSEAGFGFRFSF